MATYVKGDAVTNATSYELYEKTSSSYNLLATNTEINFNLDNLNLDSGDYILVVKAKADGYEDSDYSNEVTYTVEGGELPSETVWYTEEATAENASKAAAVANEKGYGWAHMEDAQKLFREKQINAVRFISTASSGEVNIGKVSGKDDTEGELLTSKSWSSANKDSNNIVTVVLDDTITISDTEWLVFSFGKYANTFLYTSQSKISSTSGFYGRIPQIPSGGSGSRWSEAATSSLMVDYGYVSE